MEDKHCKVCGRLIEWRKSWADDWDEIAYCSAGCRKRKLKPIDRKIEALMMQMLEKRGRGKTICPSEVVRQNWPDDEARWRSEMETARMAARRLVVAGEAEICQKGRAVDPSTANGPIRVRRRDNGAC